MLSALFAAVLGHELLLPESSLALLARGPLGALFRGFGHTFFLATLGASSVFCAIGAIIEATRGSKRGVLVGLR